MQIWILWLVPHVISIFRYSAIRHAGDFPIHMSLVEHGEHATDTCLCWNFFVWKGALPLNAENLP